jgi:hypothetical protein
LKKPRTNKESDADGFNAFLSAIYLEPGRCCAKAQAEISLPSVMADVIAMTALFVAESHEKPQSMH